MKNVIAALTEGFAEVEPGVTVSYDPTGSGAGITGATEGQRQQQLHHKQSGTNDA